MIKASALLVALAIGLLVAGVVASSLLMVYVSIGVCAVAGLLLVAGVLSHWSEIFGRREARPATPGAWSEPQVNVTAPVLASIQAVAVARGGARPGHEAVGVRPDGARPAGGRPAGDRPVGDRPPAGRADRGRADGGRVPEHPAEAIPSPAEAAGRDDEFPAPRRSEDLWERVEEELGSAAKRDTGALSWPATVFPPVPPDAPAPPQAGPLGDPSGEPRAGAGAWLWGSGAGWQPETADPAWPPPAAAFAEPQAAPERAEPGSAEPDRAEPESAGPERGEPEPAQPERAEPEPAGAAAGASGPGRAGDTASAPVPDQAAAEPAAEADVARDAGVGEAAEAVLDDGAAVGDDAALDDDAALADNAALGDGAVPDGDEVPGDGAVPDGDAVPANEAVSDAEDHEAADHEAAKPAVESTPREPAGEDSPQWIAAASHDPDADDPGADAQDADDPGADALGADDPAAGESAVKEPAAQAAPGRVEVTVVPGVSRYHRSECILIRFLGAGDLEIMTKQEAVDAKFMACRACQPDLLED